MYLTVNKDMKYLTHMKQANSFLSLLDPSKHRLGFLSAVFVISLLVLLSSITQSTLQAQILLNSQETKISGTLSKDVLGPGQHTLSIILKDAAGSTRARGDVPFSMTDTTAKLCLDLALKNRSREKKQDFGIAATVEVRKSTGEIALSAVVTSDKKGRIQITDAGLLQPLSDAERYDVLSKPKSHRRRVLKDVAQILSGGCRKMPLSSVGDFDQDGKITLADIVRAIRHFQKKDDPVVSEAYANDPLSLKHLIDLIRDRIARTGEDE